MKIRLFDSRDVTAYRELRLKALIESPTAFASCYEQEVCLSTIDFATRIQTNARSGGGFFGAFDDSERLIGMIGFSLENRSKRSHVGSLRSMYVLPEFRHQGVGARLLDEALSHIRTLGILRQLVLSVTANNLAASSLYKSRGFERFGLERDALLIDGKYFDRKHLVLFLK